MEDEDEDFAAVSERNGTCVDISDDSISAKLV